MFREDLGQPPHRLHDLDEGRVLGIEPDQKRRLEEQLASLVVPGVDAVREAGKLLADISQMELSLFMYATFWDAPYYPYYKTAL